MGVKWGRHLILDPESVQRIFHFEERFIALRLPIRSIAATVADLDAVRARPIRRDTEGLRLLAGYARGAGVARPLAARASPARRDSYPRPRDAPGGGPSRTVTR